MYLKEEKYQVLIAYAIRMISDQKTLGMFSEIIVGGITMFFVSGVDYLCIKRLVTTKSLPKQFLYTPKASFCC